jgi:hypothetical protein
VSVHNAIRPGWTCAGCAYGWPCATRKRELTAEFDGAPVSLALLMTAYFSEAAQDLAALPAGDLYTRFLMWPRQYRRIGTYEPAGELVTGSFA